ncbi:hypothetical protein [Actinomadura rubrisoli]|uniref:hypothetical protein n=1 Tax=Actinomadura rubrisoli TaxID=2530368 RepID=UPI001404A565|nr:hypothetical protein [Actinomadura rubrisoli]
MTYDDDNPTATCPWTSQCRCTHVGCTDGWLDRSRTEGHRPDGTPILKAYVEPCPTCRPEVARHLGNRSKSLRALRRELPSLPRPSRGPAHLHHQEPQP